VSDSLPLRDHYLALINDIIETTLKGKISSVEQVYQMLLKGITSGTGEVFELALSDRFTQCVFNMAEFAAVCQVFPGASLRALFAFGFGQCFGSHYVLNSDCLRVKLTRLCMS
jgi:hypothetical protein